MPTPDEVTKAAAPTPPPGDAMMAAGSGAPYGAVANLGSELNFRDMGSYGLRYFAGWPYEEFLPELQGRQAAQKFREMMDNHPIIGALMFSIVSTMRKVEWRVEPANNSPEAEEKAEFVDSCRDDMSHTWEDLVVENLSMLGYGFAPHELVYKRRLGTNPGNGPDGKPLPSSEYDDKLIGWRRIPLRGQDTIIKWFFDENGQTTGLTQQPWLGPLIDIPITKLLLFRPSQHKNNPQGRSILRSAYVPYYYSKRLTEQESILGERMGGVPEFAVPMELIQAANAGDAQAVAALNNFKKMAMNIRIDEQMGLVMPSDCFPGPNGPSAQRMYTFQLVTPAGGGRGSALNFDTSINRHNTNILTSVLADFLTLGHEARGTQSLAVTKVDMFFQAVEGFLNSTASIYNRYALPRLWDLNGFDRDLMPEIVPDIAQRVDLDVLSNFILRLSQSGMPLFPNEDLQSYILDAGGLPDTIDERALQVEGMTDEQLSMDQELQAAQLDSAKNPQPPKSPLQKMIMAHIAKRMLRAQGPRFGVTTKSLKPRSRRVAFYRKKLNGGSHPHA